MSTLSVQIEKHHRLIILLLALMIVFFLSACTFQDVLPVCHYLFGCDHLMHP